MVSIENQPKIGDYSATLVKERDPMNTETAESNNNRCWGSDWELCWELDEPNKRLTWIGDTTVNADIGLDGEPLRLVKNGYTAIVSIADEMTINICVGAIDGIPVVGKCPVLITIYPGTHVISSPGLSGGFRIYKEKTP